MKFDIRKYIWNVFELTVAQNVSSVYIGLDLFIANMELTRYRYKGTSNVDYNTIGTKWNKLSIQEKDYQRLVFKSIVTDRNIVELNRYWRLKDIKGFNDFCFMDLEIFGLKPFEIQKKKSKPKRKYKKRHKKKKSMSNNETKG